MEPAQSENETENGAKQEPVTRETYPVIFKVKEEDYCEIPEIESLGILSDRSSLSIPSTESVVSSSATDNIPSTKSIKLPVSESTSTTSRVSRTERCRKRSDSEKSSHDSKRRRSSRTREDVSMDKSHMCEYWACCKSDVKSRCLICRGFHLESGCATVTNNFERKCILIAKGICYRCMGSFAECNGQRRRCLANSICRFCLRPVHPDCFCGSSVNYLHRTELARIYRENKLPAGASVFKQIEERRIVVNLFNRDDKQNPVSKF